MGGNSSVFPVYIKAEYAGAGPAFSQLTADAKKSITDVQRAFEQGYAQVSQIVGRAMSRSRNGAGSLDIGVDEYRAAAKEADALAIATREAANAMRFQAVSAGKLSKEDQAVAAAARMAATAAEKEAQELHALAKAADLTQQALNRHKSATDAVVAASGRGAIANHSLADSSRTARNAQIQMGQQMQDVVISLAGGQRASTALAQQLPQLAFALSGVGGRVGAVATALSGPWGLALVGASFALGGFIDRLLETDKAADKAGDAQEELAAKLDIAKQGFEGATKAAADYNAEQAKAGRLAQDRIIAERNTADASLKTARDNVARLEAEIRNTPKGLSGKKGVLEVELAKARGEVAQWESTLKNSTGALAEEFARIATDDRYAIEERFKRLKNEAKAAGGDVATVTAKLAALDKQETAALAKLDKRRDRATSDGVPRFKSREDAIGIAGDELRQFGFRVSENEQFGGVRANHPGMGNAAHGKYAIDVNAGLGVNEANVPNLKAKLDALALDYQQRGYRVLWNGKVYEAGGKGPSGSIKSGSQHSDHMHIEAPSTIIGKATQRGSARAINAEFERLDDLAKLGADASRAIAGINAKWDDQPKLVDQAKSATAELGDIIEAISTAQPPNWEALVKQAEAAKSSISTFVDRDIAKWVEQSQRGMEVQKLLLSGYEDEAAVVQAIWQAREKYDDLTKAQAAEIAAQVLAEQELTREIERRQELQGSYLNTIRTLRGEVESMFSGRGFDMKRLQQSFLDLQGKVITDRLFGKAFSDLENWAKKETGFDGAVVKLESQTSRASDAISALADAANSGAARLAGGASATSPDALLNSFGATFAGSGAAKWDAITAKWDNEFGRSLGGFANDNDIASAQKKAMKNSALGLNPPEFFMQMKKSISLGLESTLGPISGPVSGFLAGSVVGGKAGGAIGLLSSLGLGKVSGLAGRALGGLGDGSMIGSMLGLNSTGSAIGGVAGSLLGIGGIGGGLLGGLVGGGNTKGKLIGAGIGGLAGGLIGGALLAGGGGAAAGAMSGAVLGPLGIIGGALIGALLAGIFKKAKTGSASVSNGAVSLGGNNAERRDKLNSATGGISDAIANIADQLGGTVGNYGYTIGIRKDEYRVSGSAGANVTSKNPGGLLYKGKDGEEAARIALLNAIQDGAIAGIRAGAQRLLASGKDLERQVQKALSLQSIFDRLQAHDDPMGYALGKLDREFANLRSIATEAGEGMVEVEKLYAIERARVIEETNKQITASLRDLYDSLTVGSDARSLGERRAYALASYDPLAARVAAGDKAAYDDFAAAAQALLDIERQMFGSQGGYFSRLDEITQLTKTRIDAESNVASIAAGGGSSAANDNVPVVNAIDSQTAAIVALGNQGNSLAAETNALLGQLLAQGGGGSGSLLSYAQLF